jgi:hypothetical protein
VPEHTVPRPGRLPHQCSFLQPVRLLYKENRPCTLQRLTPSRPCIKAHATTGQTGEDGTWYEGVRRDGPRAGG